jgi:hypothetical protein
MSRVKELTTPRLAGWRGLVPIALGVAAYAVFRLAGMSHADSWLSALTFVVLRELGVIDAREAETRDLLFDVNAHAWMLRDAARRIDSKAVDAALLDAAKRDGEDVPAQRSEP